MPNCYLKITSYKVLYSTVSSKFVKSNIIEVRSHSLLEFYFTLFSMVVKGEKIFGPVSLIRLYNVFIFWHFVQNTLCYAKRITEQYCIWQEKNSTFMYSRVCVLYSTLFSINLFLYCTFVVQSPKSFKIKNFI